MNALTALQRHATLQCCLQTELNISGIIARTINLAECRAALQTGVEGIVPTENRMIERVEEVTAELHTEAFRSERFRNRYIQILGPCLAQRWNSDRAVTQTGLAVRIGESIRIDPLIRRLILRNGISNQV